jgi:hypothetical protein
MAGAAAAASWPSAASTARTTAAIVSSEAAGLAADPRTVAPSKCEPVLALPAVGTDAGAAYAAQAPAAGMSEVPSP